MINRNIKTVKGLVKDLRTIRDNMNRELEKMTSEERKEHFRRLRAKSHSPQ